MPAPENFMTSKQVADCYNVHINTVYKWRTQGLPYYEMGEKTLRYDPEEVAKWIADNKRRVRPKK